MGWLGAVESMFVIVISIFGLANVETIMNHLRNETELYTANLGNDTHLSVFRKRNHGEMSAEDAMFIERGNHSFLKNIYDAFSHSPPTFPRNVCDVDA